MVIPAVAARDHALQLALGEIITGKDPSIPLLAKMVLSSGVMARFSTLSTEGTSG
jgi:hypothetical protein